MKRDEKTAKIDVQKDENVDETLTLTEGMMVLYVEKIEMTMMGLRIAAIRDGFKSEKRGEGREKFLLDNDRFFEWLQRLDKFAPTEYVPVSFFARGKGISTAYVYSIIRKYRIKTRIFGGGRGKIYINAKQVEKKLGKKGKNHKSLVKRTRLSYKSRYEGYEDFLQAVI